MDLDGGYFPPQVSKDSTSFKGLLMYKSEAQKLHSA
jgi:hypothetical protein